MVRKAATRYVILALIFLVIDRVTKEWAIRVLQNAPSWDLFHIFGIDVLLSFATNSGAAWGILSSYPSVLITLRFFFVGFLLSMAFFTHLPSLACWGLSLIISGACSNLIDAFDYGFVVDMIHIRFWGYDYPVFNVADSCISMGAILFLIAMWKFDKE